MSLASPGRRRFLAGTGVALASGLVHAGRLDGLERRPEEDLERALAGFDGERRPGLVAGFCRVGEPAWLRSLGQASLEHGAPATPRTRFEIASVSKQFTAYAFGRLVAETGLDPEAPVGELVDDLPAFAAAVPLISLVHHTSGLKDCLWWLELAGRPDDGDLVSEAAVLRLLRAQRGPAFPAGERFLYNNTGYVLLGRAIRAVSGLSLAEYSRRHIFEPLGMARTLIADDAGAIVEGRASGYLDEDSRERPLPGGEWRRAPVRFEAVGATGVLTTAEDMARWTRHLLELVAADAPLARWMGRSGRLNDGTPVGYGGGLFLRERDGRTVWSHGGSLGGFRSSFMLIPDEAVAAFVLSGAPFGGAGVTEAMLAPYLPAAAAEVEQAEKGEEAIPEALLERVAGSYQPDDWKMVRLERRDGALWWHEAGSPPRRLVLHEDGRFGPASGGTARYAPRWNEAGEVEALAVGFLDDPQAPPVHYPRVEPAAPSMEELAELVGDYRSREYDATHRLHLENGHLHLRASWSAEPQRLHPATRDRFDGERFGWSVRVGRDEAGRVTGLWVGSMRAPDNWFARLERPDDERC